MRSLVERWVFWSGFGWDVGGMVFRMFVFLGFGFLGGVWGMGGWMGGVVERGRGGEIVGEVRL